MIEHVETRMAGDAEIGLAHGRVGGKARRLALADDAAGLDEVATIGDRQAFLGILLDKQHADAGVANMGQRLEQFMGQHRRQAE